MLLRTKLYIPALRPQLVPRPQLIDRLNDTFRLGHKLTLISAPPGFGKTTLVSEWVGRLRRDPPQDSPSENRVAWLSLDEGDNDPVRFLTYLIAALNQAESIDQTVGQGALGLLSASRLPPVEEVLTLLINDISAVTGRITLILDDYHLIDASPIDAALIFLIEHLPPQVHLVIATRDDPPLPLARLRARGQLTELRAADLRFTSSETAEFLNQVMGLDLSMANVTALESRTEGWITGLQLAALALQGTQSLSGRKDVANLIDSFAGSHRFVLDYLIEEVLEQQSGTAQTFLLQTAILDRLSGPLCDALTDQDNGQATLEALEGENLFIIPLDEERQWYRYHRLFADFLRLRLHQMQPDQSPTLHYRASAWYAQNGFPAEAIDHALRANDHHRAARLIQQHGDTFWGQGEHRKLQRWLAELPGDLLSAKPHLSILQARYLCNSGQMAAAEQTLEAVERLLDPGSPKAIPLSEPERVMLRGRAAATRALINSYQGNVPGIIQHASQALETLPKDDLTWRSVTALTLGNAHGFKGDMAAAYRARAQALKACEAAGDLYFIMIANLELAITLREQGRLLRTLEICQRQLRFARQYGLSQLRTVGWLQAVWGETLAELNDLDEAFDRAQEGFQLTERSGDLQMFGWSFMCLIRVLLSRGELALAQETIQRMVNIPRDSYLPPWIANQVTAWQARLWLAQNEVEAAAQWASERGLITNGQFKLHPEIDFFLLFDYLVLARILIAQERLDDSTRLLQHLLQVAKAGARTSKVIEIKLLQALTAQAQDELDPALSQLEQAFTLAEPKGFVRLFVDEGPPLVHLLHEALKRGMTPEYVHCLLSAYALAEPEPVGPAISQPDQSSLVEPLSERELEVLQGIAQGFTNREIADRLYLSLNTIKVHTRNIYGKLNVHSRTQAIARAQELELLSPPPD